MGSPLAEPCRLSNEDLHPVQLTHAFSITATEVTRQAYQVINNDSPSQLTGCGSDCPVESISWSDAAAFCNNLSKHMGLQAQERCYVCVGQGDNYTRPHDCKVRAPYDGVGGTHSIYDCPGYRLPTEAEWEYAYRAGSQSSLYNGAITDCYKDSRVAAIGWYHQNSGGTLHAVAGKQPNAWGLHDMAGNVWEWVNDWYAPALGAGPDTDPSGPASGKAHVIRGGAWQTSAGSTRGAQRNQSEGAKTFDFVGFRVARTL